MDNILRLIADLIATLLVCAIYGLYTSNGADIDVWASDRAASNDRADAVHRQIEAAKPAVA